LLTAVQNSKPAQIRKFYQQHVGRRGNVIDRRLQEIRATCALTDSVAVITASVMIVRTIVPMLRAPIDGVF